MSWTRGEWLLFLCFGCAPAASPLAELGATLPSAYDPDLGESSPAEHDLAQIEADADAILAQVRSINAAPVPAVFEEVLTWGDADCPAYKVLSDGAAYWESICSTDDGTSFEGDAFYAVLEGEDADGLRYLRHELFTHARVAREDGQGFRGAGNLVVEEKLAEDGHGEFKSSVIGTFVSTSAMAEGLWISQGVEDNLEARYGTNNRGEPQYAVLSGSVGGLPLTYGEAWFEDFKIGSEAGMWACAGEPLGALSLRDGAGRWVTITFDTVDFQGSAPEDPARCDGCGAVSAMGEALGEVCVDASPLLDWEGAPW